MNINVEWTQLWEWAKVWASKQFKCIGANISVDVLFSGTVGACSSIDASSPLAVTPQH
jgi:hypothetical protein